MNDFVEINKGKKKIKKTIKEAHMNFKAVVFILIFIIYCGGTIFAIDYSQYKYEQFTVPKSNPAYLVMPCGKATDGSVIKIEGNRWVVPLGPFWYVSLSQSLLDKFIKAKNENDSFILFYQRRGNYVDISKYTGTTDPGLIRRDTQGQIAYIEATAKAYTFIADDILTYSEIMSGISKDMQTILLTEENRSEENGGIKIFLAFMQGQMNGARSYVNSRIKAIEASNAQAQAERDAQAQRAAAERQKRLNEQKAAEDRANTLKTALIMGYKPCFNIESFTDLPPFVPFTKIAVVGRLGTFYDKYCIFPFNYSMYDRETISLLQNINYKDIFKPWTNYIFFLTKTNDDDKMYVMDGYILLDYIVNIRNLEPGSSSQPALEEWILTNNGKQSVQFLNNVEAFNPLETALIMGYKPFLNANNSASFNSFTKVVIVGNFLNPSDYTKITHMNNKISRQDIPLIENKAYSGLFEPWTYYIFFLTKITENANSRGYQTTKYNIDSYLLLNNVVDINNLPDESSIESALNEWVLANNGKQNIQFLNTVKSP